MLNPGEQALDRAIRLRGYAVVASARDHQRGEILTMVRAYDAYPPYPVRCVVIGPTDKADWIEHCIALGFPTAHTRFGERFFRVIVD